MRRERGGGCAEGAYKHGNGQKIIPRKTKGPLGDRDLFGRPHVKRRKQQGGWKSKRSSNEEASLLQSRYVLGEKM